MFRRIFEISYYSEGGITYSEAYALPVWHRNFVYQEIKETKEKEKEEMDKISKSKNNTSSAKPKIPAFAASKPAQGNLSKYKNAIKNPKTK